MGDQVAVAGNSLLGGLVLLKGISEGDTLFSALELLGVDCCLPLNFHLFGGFLVGGFCRTDVLPTVALERHVPILAVSPFDDAHGVSPIQ
jgi:hypothetical protein